MLTSSLAVVAPLNLDTAHVYVIGLRQSSHASYYHYSTRGKKSTRLI